MKIISFFRATLLIILIALSINHVYGADSKSYQTFLNEYKDLFLTDTDRLHLEGRHEEAKQEKMRDWRTKDCVCNIPTEESLVKKDRQDKLIQMICQNIENVKKSYEEDKDALLKCYENIDSITND